MKKIGIVTNYANTNYGSALQSFALQFKLSTLGYSCENIRYSYGKKVSKLMLIRIILGRVKRWSLACQDRKDRFRIFRRNFIQEGSCLYTNLDELEDTNRIYDGFICGSDQIWAPNQFDEWYYLSFVERDKPKIAYAPSIGLPVIPSRLQDSMRDLILRIDSVSIREEQGAEIIQNLADVDAPVVLDPTLLLNKKQWMKVASKCEVKGDYAFCYLLGENPTHRRAARAYCDEHRLRLVAPFAKGDMSLFDDVLAGIGPGEFLDLISKASVVLTDSFHGAAFSVNFEKDFYVFLRFSVGDKLCQNSRVYNLLDTFDLRDRLISSESGVVEERSVINYNAVSDVLGKWRSASVDYLVKALSAV